MTKKDLERQKVRETEYARDSALDLIKQLERIYTIDPGAYIGADVDYDTADVIIYYDRPETDEEYTKRIAKIKKAEEKRKKAQVEKKKRVEEKERREFERLRRNLRESNDV